VHDRVWPNSSLPWQALQARSTEAEHACKEKQAWEAVRVQMLQQTRQLEKDAAASRQALSVQLSDLQAQNEALSRELEVQPQLSCQYHAPPSVCVWTS
jgi:hypothetical protein